MLCGGISGYNATEPQPGPRNILNLVVQRATMQGFLVLDYLPKSQEAVKKLAGLVMEGKIKHLEDIQEGLENCPQTLNRLFTGENFGKQMLKL